MAYQVTLRMQNGVEREVACYGYECHIAHSDRPDIGRIIAAHMEVCQKLGTADYLPVEGDLIAVTFESTDHDNFFYEWLLQGNMANGEIEFATGDDIVDIFRFWDCYCVSLEETLCTGEMPMLMTVLLSPGILKRMNCEPREKVWKVSDISVKPRVVDNDETHNSEPMVLVTSVKGKSKAIVSQTVQYVVTKYSVSNVKDSDRKRVKWVIEVDGQKEYLKEQGETLDLQIKEEWEGKEIIVMPYLKKYTSVISVKTYVGEKLSLFFNGKVLIFRVVENDKILRFNYKAVSGRPLKDGSFDYSKQRQKLPSIGPLPEGNYYIKPQEIQYAKDRTTIDKIIGNIGIGTMPGGERSWGIGRVWIYPQSVIIDGVVRGNFSIHGGDTPGSAGCIDLTSNDRSFFDVLEKYKGKCEKISLKVNYGIK